MSESLSAAVFTALWLGILTSISPCPLATNIAAVSFISKHVKHPVSVVMTGLLYTLGRTLAYLALGILIVQSILETPALSRFLNQHINKFLGPILIIAGLFLLEILKFALPGWNPGAKLQQKVNLWGIWGAFPLGIIFALSFCPVSAALFFGSLIPIALSMESGVFVPSVYGIGTALPVVLFSILIAFGAKWIGSVFNKITQIEKFLRYGTGVLFILVGIYFVLMYNFKIL